MTEQLTSSMNCQLCNREGTGSRGQLTPKMAKAQNDTSKTANIVYIIFNKKGNNTIAAINISVICC